MNIKITAFSLVFIILAVLSLSFFMDNVSIKEGLRPTPPKTKSTTTPPKTKSITTPPKTKSTTTSPITTAPTTQPVSFSFCDEKYKPLYPIGDKKCNDECEYANIKWEKNGCPSLSTPSPLNDDPCTNISIPPFPMNDDRCNTDCQNANIAWNKCGRKEIV